MTPLATYPTCIGWGIASALGPSARHTGFYLRAGRNNFSLSPFIDPLGEPITMSCVTTLPKDLVGPRRLFVLAAQAIDEALEPLMSELAGQRLRLCLTLPPHHVGKGPKAYERGGEDLVSLLLERTSLRKHRVEVVEVPGGRTAGAVASIAQWLARGEVDIVVLCGVDSYYEWAALERLWGQDRLLTEDNIDGLRPGEGAACLVLTAPHHNLARSRGVSELIAAGEGHEPSQPGLDEPANMAQGLSAALRDAVVPLRERKRRTNSWFSDMTHEAFRIREFQIVIARFGDVAGTQMSLQLPARELGDAGAAKLTLFAALATEAWYRGYASDNTALCFAGSDDGVRGAVLLQAKNR